MSKNYTLAHVRSTKTLKKAPIVKSELPSEFVIQQILNYSKALEIKKMDDKRVFCWMLN